MPVSTLAPSILPPGSLHRLLSLEDRIAYNEHDDQVNLQWLLKLLVKLEEIAPAEEEEGVSDESAIDTSKASKVVSARKAIIETPQEEEYRLQHEQLTEKVSSCLAHFCGRAASGAMTRTWTFKTTPPQSLQIHDPSFTGGDVGFKTFGSAYLLSKHIAHGDIPQLESWTSASYSFSSSSASSVPHPRILELGSGTGLVGFTAALFSNPRGPKVVLSDYHPNVISTLHHNSALNHLDTRCDIQLLDWRDILGRRKLRWNGAQEEPTVVQQRSTEYDIVAPTSLPSFSSSAATAATTATSNSVSCQEMSEQDRMDLILGAEVVYDHGHAELVAHVVDEYLKRDLISTDPSLPLSKRRPAFHIMFPIRKTHTDVIAEFDFWMDKMGLVDCRMAKEWGREDGETKFLYHWREYVRKEHL
ncbi:hypothetical protein BG011_005961 [Mortierella polycephala]|uniref:Uncharacterized protein n=1 Tax=Mortierella polycephala TaxID=41804 RepID=A0A9P6U9D7_9FUNG|nr:hypothetical protein BG011_005961 [Mortierella polycephala]